ncbi:MAG TPA: hypothetical protein VHG28_10525, partial [Longimicrobiaceae bacterium]|nr:hypothetical protein [Longimicrobiaceae bacterium]
MSHDPTTLVPGSGATAPLYLAVGAGGEGVLRTFFTGRAATCSALLLVAGKSAGARRWGVEAAVQLASAAARHRRTVILADLDLDAPLLHERLGDPGDEGATDVILYGVSVRHAARPVEGRGFSLLPAGPPAADPGEVLIHPHWSIVFAEVARAQGLLLLYVPADAPGLAD